MRTTLRTLLVSLTATTALVTMTAGSSTAATTAGVVSLHRCYGDDCLRSAEVNQTAFQIGLSNKLIAILDELPSAGVGRPGAKG